MSAATDICPASVETRPISAEAFAPFGDMIVVGSGASNAQVINIARTTWHGVLAPISGSGHFAVIDRIGDGTNRDAYRMEAPVCVMPNHNETYIMGGQTHG